MARLANLTNVAQGSYYGIMLVANLKNLAIQYYLEAAASDVIELQLWGTVHTDAIETTDENVDKDWHEVTEFLTEHENQSFTITGKTEHDIVFLDSSITLAKIKVRYIVTTATPNNIISIGWTTNV